MIKKTYSFVNGGEVCDVYTLSNKKGVEVDILTYGARIIRLLAPDKKGELGDIIVGCKTPEDYCKKNPCFGSTVGRYANRIENATFVLNGERYYLEKNDGEHTLHGGHTACFDCRVWDAEIKDETLVMRLVSPDGEGGFPGRMEVEVAFTLTESGELVINLTPTSLVRKADYCGIYTGKKVDKFKRCGLTKEAAQSVKCPLIAESPLSIDCRVFDMIELGTHDMFLCDIVGVDVDESIIDKNGKLRLDKADLTAYAHGEYFELGKKLGSFGFSAVRKKKKK